MERLHEIINVVENTDLIEDATAIRAKANGCTYLRRDVIVGLQDNKVNVVSEKGVGKCEASDGATHYDHAELGLRGLLHGEGDRQSTYCVQKVTT